MPNDRKTRFPHMRALECSQRMPRRFLVKAGTSSVEAFCSRVLYSEYNSTKNKHVSKGNSMPPSVGIGRAHPRHDLQGMRTTQDARQSSRARARGTRSPAASPGVFEARIRARALRSLPPTTHKRARARWTATTDGVNCRLVCGRRRRLFAHAPRRADRASCRA